MNHATDTLSRLLQLYPVRTTLDIRCHFGAPWQLPEPTSAPGVVRYHMIVSGDALMEANGERGVALQAGDIVVFPRGSAHKLHAGRGKAIAQQVATRSDDLLIRMENGGAGAE
uniref:cupin domain-containing protein n=1 Tax=Herbaspirillum lusitanum TaxID=213312 RepID=UPI0004946338